MRFPAKSRHDIQIEKNVSNRLHRSHTRTVTNYQALITKGYTRSRHIRPWNLKKTKSSKRSKLKENFIHIDCFEVQIIIENPLPAFRTTNNFQRRKNDQADVKNSWLPLLFPFFPRVQTFRWFRFSSPTLWCFSPSAWCFLHFPAQGMYLSLGSLLLPLGIWNALFGSIVCQALTAIINGCALCLCAFKMHLFT